LGTFVEVRADFADAAHAQAGMTSAFAAAARVQTLMSFHDPGSDLARINRDAAHAPVRVDQEVIAVLSAGLALARDSGGAFDFTIGRQLVQAGLLPRPAADRPVTPGAGGWQHDHTAVELGAGDTVRLHAPVWIDLGGIAKGYAVDRMVDALRAHGAAGGCVNAGGDLRLFGTAREVVHVRHPEAPGRLLPIGPLGDIALASSGDYFCGGASPLVDPRGGRAQPRRQAITVTAPSCMVADALTKVVALLGEAARPLLRAQRARAYAVCERHGLAAVAA
jgi:thiamine biosynthesis lipoprotein